MASQLMQQLLAQALQEQQQPMLSPLQPLAKFALAAVLKQNDKKLKKEAEAKAGTLAEAMAPLPAQQDLTAFSGMAPGTPEAPRYWGNTVPAFQKEAAAQQLQAVNEPRQKLLKAVMGGDPSIGQELALKDILGGQELERQKALASNKFELDKTLQAQRDAAAMERTLQQGRDRVTAASRRGPLVTVNGPNPLSEDKPSLRDWAQIETGTRNLLGTTKRVRELVATGSPTGPTGWLVRGGNVLADQARQLALMTGGTNDSLLQNPRLYSDVVNKFAWLTPEAKKSAAVQTNLTRLAYMIARTDNPTGQISKSDVRDAMESLAASGGSVDQLTSALDETEALARLNASNRHESIFGAEKEKPAWLTPAAPPAPDIPGFDELTPAEQEELRARLGKAGGR